MKKITLILPLIMLACSEEEMLKKESFVDSMTTEAPSESEDMIEKTENVLQQTEGLEEEIKQTYKTKETLLKENKQLKKEIKSMKDSLIEVKSKLPKKQSFIQKVFKIKPDSIEIKTVDTIQIKTIK